MKYQQGERHAVDDEEFEGQGSLSREIPFQRGRVKRVEKVSTFAPLPLRLFTSFLIVPLLFFTVPTLPLFILSS
jgi:hypothetical protein